MVGRGPTDFGHVNAKLERLPISMRKGRIARLPKRAARTWASPAVPAVNKSMQCTLRGEGAQVQRGRADWRVQNATRCVRGAGGWLKQVTRVAEEGRLGLAWTGLDGLG